MAKFDFEPFEFTPVLSTGTPIDQLNEVTYSSEDGSLLSFHGGLGRITLIYGLPCTHKTRLAMNLIIGAAERFPESSLVISGWRTDQISPEEIRKFSSVPDSTITERFATFRINEDTSLNEFVEYLNHIAIARHGNKESLTIDTNIYNPYTERPHRMFPPMFVLVDDWDDLYVKVPDGRPTSVLEAGLAKSELLKSLPKICHAANIYLVIVSNMTKQMSPRTGQPEGYNLYPSGRLAFLSNVALRVENVSTDDAGVVTQFVRLIRCMWATSDRETKLQYSPDGGLIRLS